MKNPLVCLTGICMAAAALAADWHVDSEAGNDAADGLTPQTALKTLSAVNRAAIQPGDRVLFKRGGLWRGSLTPKSGQPGRPVVYGSYGTGPKPILQKSADRSRPEDWVETAPGVWATRVREDRIYEQVWSGTECRGWTGSFQEGVRGYVKRVESPEDGTFVRVVCTEQPKRANHLIQIWGPRVDGLPEAVLLKMKARATKPFKIEQVGLSLNHSPWTYGLRGAVLGEGDATAELGPEWKTVLVPMSLKADILGSHFHFSIGDLMPVGCTFDFVPLGLWRMESDPRHTLPYDAGIFIADHGKAWGVKKWSLDALKKPLDFWDDRAHERVFVRFDGNPAAAFRSIELAMTSHVVQQGGCHDVVYDGLCVRYTGAHGWGGGNTRNIVIRNCDVYWIGGGLQYWKVRKDGTRYPVRFGNGIEFWGHCVNNLVERNRIWQVYDAALTNQTNGDPKPETDVVWRDNVIWQAEYSFEYWNHDLRSHTANILFEHNTCVDAGYCYSHDQRPDVNGAHLMFYDNAAPTTNFVVRNNVFVRTTDRSTRMFNDWRAKDGSDAGLTMDHNLYFIPENKIYEYHVNGREKAQNKPGIRLTPASYGAGAEEFAKYVSEMRLDAGSVYGEPQFVDEAKRDYRLKPGTFGSDLATDGGPLGARNMPGLDEDQSRPLK